MNHSHWFLIGVGGLVMVVASVFGQSLEKGSDKANDPKIVTVTGCLAQSDTPDHGFLLKDGTGKAYGLESTDQNLKAHLTHKVTITGTSLKGEGAHDDERIKVSEVKMISANCP